MYEDPIGPGVFLTSMNQEVFSVCVEIFGYIASLLVVFSLTRTSVKKLWTINAFGCAGFIIFALITHSYPTALMNLGALVIDLVQLYRLSHVSDNFELVPANPQSEYFKWFVEKNKSDIYSIDEGNAYKTAEKLFYYVRNNEVAGILAYTPKSDNENGEVAVIILDYVTQKFRDCKIGLYFFDKENPYIKDTNISSFVTHTINPAHENYLRKIHFSHVDGDKWVKVF